MHRLQFLPPQHKTMSFTQSLWCSMLWMYGSCVLDCAEFQTRIIASRPAEYSRPLLWSSCNAFTPFRCRFSSASRITNDTCIFFRPTWLLLFDIIMISIEFSAFFHFRSLHVKSEEEKNPDRHESDNRTPLITLRLSISIVFLLVYRYYLVFLFVWNTSECDFNAIFYQIASHEMKSFYFLQNTKINKEFFNIICSMKFSFQLSTNVKTTVKRHGCGNLVFSTAVDPTKPLVCANLKYSNHFPAGIFSFAFSCILNIVLRSPIPLLNNSK